MSFFEIHDPVFATFVMGNAGFRVKLAFCRGFLSIGGGHKHAHLQV